MHRGRERGGVWRFVGVALLAAWVVSPVAAQIGAGAVTGDVVDQAGASVPGATVTVTAVATNASRTVVTDADGAYSVPSLTPGLYRIQATRPGFRPLTREGVRVTTGETVRVELRLEVGGVAEAVTVTADAPLLRSGTSGLGQVVDTRKVTELPLNGRSFITLASLVPGVALPPGSTLPRINGGRPRTNEYLFDGISVLQPEPGQVAFYPNVDAIQEFKIETNSPPAEFGRFNGGVVNLTTKAGGNTVHGSAFEFLRNEALNARNFFASTAAVKPEFRRNQFGGVAGGPIKRDRLFFFADYQGQRQSIGRTVISTVPTLLQRQGIFTEAIAGRVPLIYDPATGTTGRTPVSRQLDSRGPNRSRGAGAAGALSDADQHRHRQQLPAPGQRAGGPGSVQRAPRREAARQPRPGVRATDAVPRGVSPRDAAAGRERRHRRHARSPGHALVGVRLQLPAHAVGPVAERTARGRHAPVGRPDGRAAHDIGVGGARPARHPLNRTVPQHAADVPHRGLPAAGVAD